MFQVKMIMFLSVVCLYWFLHELYSRITVLIMVALFCGWMGYTYGVNVGEEITLANHPYCKK